MESHLFLFEAGQWIGEGRVKFSASPEQIKFYTKWTIPAATGDENPIIRCTQQVEMQGSSEQVVNNFQLSNISNGSFAIQIENDLVGKVQGKGVTDAKTIAWEFRGHPGFEGFEVYELTDNGDYMLHAEYSSPDQFRTIIDGRIWKKLVST